MILGWGNDLGGHLLFWKSSYARLREKVLQNTTVRNK